MGKGKRGRVTPSEWWLAKVPATLLDQWQQASAQHPDLPVAHFEFPLTQEKHKQVPFFDLSFLLISIQAKVLSAQETPKGKEFVFEMKESYKDQNLPFVVFSQAKDKKGECRASWDSEAFSRCDSRGI